MQPQITPAITLDDFTKNIKQLRIQHIACPEKAVYNAFKAVIENMPRAKPHLGLEQLGLLNYLEPLILSQASSVVEQTRKKTWEQYRENENGLCNALIKQLFPTEMLQPLTPEQTQSLVAECMHDYFYEIALSNNQSRRNLAGREFGALLELLFCGVGITTQHKGTIREYDQERAINLVIPSSSHLSAEPTKTALISAKITLRESWQELIEESKRFKSSKMYLATLDDKITKQTINLLQNANICIVTTPRNKAALCNNCRLSSANAAKILSFEEMLVEVKDLTKSYDYTRWDDTSCGCLNSFYSTFIYDDPRPLIRDFYKQQLKALQQQRPRVDPIIAMWTSQVDGKI